MTNKNVIEIIDRLMDTKAERLAYNVEEVFTAIAHGYYYIRPGRDTYKFNKKIHKILEKGWDANNKAYSETRDGIPFDEWVLGKVAADTLVVARSMFDREYYISQIPKTNMSLRYEDDLLEDYLHYLDKNELRTIWDVLGFFKVKTDAFASDESFECMMEEFREACINIVNDFPYYSANRYEHIARIDNTVDFFFDYLNRGSIIDIISSYVDRDRLILANMIKAFMHSDIQTAVEYTGMSLYIEENFEIDICNPIITDVEGINFDPLINDCAKVVYRNKCGRVIAA